MNKPARDPLLSIPNVGPAIAGDLRLLGVRSVSDLKRKDPWRMYEALCRKAHRRQDPCVLDTFLAVVDFARTGRARPWWKYTSLRKSRIGS